MTSVSIVFTGCSEQELKTFSTSARLPELEEAASACAVRDGDLVCRIKPTLLERLYDIISREAEKGWEDPDDTNVLPFDSAFFPHSPDEVMPVRQLRGLVAARLDRKKRNLPPAFATPGFVFGTAEGNEIATAAAE